MCENGLMSKAHEIPDPARGFGSLMYQNGFGNQFGTQAREGALPEGRNSPQRCGYGLYAEQLSGTAFTAPRAANRRSWLYRIRPAAVHGPFQPLPSSRITNDFTQVPTPPDRLRWDPLPMPEDPTDFVDGLVTMGVTVIPPSRAAVA